VSHLTPVPSDPEQFRAWMEAQRNEVIDLPETPEQAQILTIKVTLDDTEPAVWRRLEIAGDTTLDQVHEVLQVAMGWTDSHLHRFFSGMAPDASYFVTDYDIEEGDDGTPEAEARLDQVLRERGDRLRYEYDFGDGWDHELLLEGVAPLTEHGPPRCVGGGLACPPEDVGGTGGYADVAAWVRGGRRADAVPPQFESLEHALGWLPADWDPDDFDAEQVDLQLQALVASGELLQRLKPEALEAVMRLSAAQATVSGWLAQAAGTPLQPADLDAVTEPYRQLLAIIGGAVELTASGYLRPPVVKELCQVFAIHPILAGKANRESNIRPLVMFRKGAQQVGLLHTSRGILTPTAAGISLGDDAKELWRHVAGRLPSGRGDLKTDVGWFTLLALAGGVEHVDIYDTVHQLCVDAGWEDEQGDPIEFGMVNPLVWPTLSAVVGPRWNSLGPREPWPPWVPAAAASVLFPDLLE
jgi:hypothetical protein